jgi:LacI family transcriptional regulator
MAEKVTILDIARLARVSTGTVSRVLNNKPDVDPITRERVLRIVEEKGYMPSITAAGLAVGRNRLISVLAPEFTWPLVPEVMLGVAKFIEESPYEMVLYSISTANHERDWRKVIERILATRLTAGLLAIFPGQSAQHLTEVQRRDFPVVLIDDQSSPEQGLPWVGAENRAGAYEAMRYLIQLGHTRIAYIQGPMKYKVSHDRYQGYCDALQDAGIKLDPALVQEGDFMITGGHNCAKAFFARPVSERPTAIFASSDLMAYGVISAAEEAGLRIPEDISLVGFDDNPSSAHIRPALTTVRQPFSDMGQHAIELLFRLIERSRSAQQTQLDQKRPLYNAAAEAVPRMQMPTSLIIRESSGAP